MQLHKAKEQFIGQMAMSEENYNNLMLMHGKSMLIHNQIESFDTVVKKIRNVSAGELHQIANEILAENKLSFLYFLPIN